MSEPLDIAIIGLSGCYAGAKDARAFWQNILDKVDAVGPAGEEWAGPYVHPNPTTNDRIYTTRGGFLRDLAEVDPAEFGVMPSVANGGEPDHLLALKHARDALADSGYLTKPFDRQKAGIVIGRGTYANRGQVNLLSHGLFIDQTMDIVRGLRPDLTDEDLASLRAALKGQLPPYTAELIGPLTPNVIAGLIANRLDLMGPNFIVDAACASSLIAIELAARELASQRCDLVLTGGVQAQCPPQLYMQFCQLNALSRGQLRPFQKGADGTLLGEGVGVLVLKRLADAERDGDRIYAVIKGIGTASDGKAKGLLTPRLEGEVLALRRAYESCGIDPATIGLIEAHGTGTKVGDKTEIESLTQLFGPRSGELPHIALGSVKSMISHCLPASGSASIIKTALALYHKVLPPMLCDELDPELGMERTPFYLNTEPRPWIHGGPHPRRAGVNAFGFGGINAHVILEEYVPKTRTQHAMLHAPGSTELVTLAADSLADLLTQAQQLLEHVRGPSAPALARLAKASAAESRGAHRLAIVASSTADLDAKLDQTITKLHRPDAAAFKTRGGVFYGTGPAPGRTCFIFPGEGAQYPDMLADVCMSFPQAREWLDFIEETAVKRGSRARAPVVFPPPTAIDERTRKGLDDAIYEMDIAAETVFAASMGMQAILDDLGLHADAMLGHSTGENTAITASGVRRFGERQEIADTVRDLNAIYRGLETEGRIAEGSLLTIGALKADARAALIEKHCSGGSGIHVAMDNCPNQLVLFGSRGDISALKDRLADEGAICAELPFGRAYHTALFKPLADAYRAYYAKLDFGPGRSVLYSAQSAAPFPHEPDAIRELACAQWESPVRFTETLQRLYADGYRIFVEVGPSANMTSFVGDTLREHEDVIAVATNSRRKAGIAQLHNTLAQLFAAGVSMQPAALYAGREIAAIDLTAPPPAAAKPKPKLKLQMPTIKLPADWKPAIRRNRRSTDVQPEDADHPKVVRIETAAAERRAEAAAALAPTAPTVVTAPPVIVDPRLEALKTHFSLMQEFLDSQARVLSGIGAANTVTPTLPLMQPANAETPAVVAAFESGARPDPNLYPLLGPVLERTADRLVCQRTYDSNLDLFLEDHAIGSLPTDRQPKLLPLTVIPFTFSMEILAEAACLLTDERLKVIGLDNSRGHRWLGLDGGNLPLRIVAERLPSPAAGNTQSGFERIAVKLFQQNAGGPPGGGGALVFEGTVLLADRYPDPPTPRPWTAAQDFPARNNPDGELYSHGMFHGPRLQGVKSIRRWGDEAIEADMATISTHDYFSFSPQPKLRLDSALLDAAGQLAGYWLTEKHTWGFNCFPYHLGHYTQYCDPLPANRKLICRGDVRMSDDLRIEAHFDLIDDSGRLVMRAANWDDRKFSVPQHLYDFRLEPQVRFMSDAWAPVGPVEPGISVRRLIPFEEGFLDQGWGVWKRMLANLVLCNEERQVFYHQLPVIGPRREEWLMGRVAAKDAVREWALAKHGVKLAPADVMIATGQRGEPVVARCDGLSASIPLPVISISHSRGWAVGVCAAADAVLGVDYQHLDRVDAEDLIAGAFVADEAQAFFSTVAPTQRKRAAVALWCAKEAASKAAGTGLESRPQDWRVISAEFERRGARPAQAVVQRGTTAYAVDLHIGEADVFALCRSRSEGLPKTGTA
jgi:acyl transferase domain-containing protein/phosphopantetheinyl transferase